MKISPIESQNRISESPIGARGFTTGHAKNTDKRTNAKKVIVNLTPEINMYTSTQFIGATVQSIFGANKNRRYLLIQNVGAVTVFLGFGSTPDVAGNNSIELPSGFQISFENGYVPNNECKAICASQSKISILEGQLA